MRRARRDGAATVGLVTRDVMASAQRLYRSMGFERRPEHDAGAGDGFLVYAMDLPSEPSL